LTKKREKLIWCVQDWDHHFPLLAVSPWTRANFCKMSSNEWLLFAAWTGFSVRFKVDGTSFGVGGEGKNLCQRRNLWAPKVWVSGKNLKSGLLRIHLQHSGAKIRVLEQNTEIIKFWLFLLIDSTWILFLNRDNFQRKVGGKFMWNSQRIFAGHRLLLKTLLEAFDSLASNPH